MREQLVQAQQIQATLSVFAAILAEGSVMTGAMVTGQLVCVGQIQATQGAVAAVLEDGSVVTWGLHIYAGDSSQAQEQLVQVRQIQATQRAFAAILADGFVVTWGHPDWGDSSQALSVQQIQATASAFAAILADGCVVTWGDPNHGGESSRIQDQFGCLYEVCLADVRVQRFYRVESSLPCFPHLTIHHGTRGRCLIPHFPIWPKM